MNKTLYLFLSLLFAATTNAAVVDHFSCKVTVVKSDGAPLYSSVVDSYAMRMTHYLKPSPTDWISFGQVVLYAAGTKHSHAQLALQYSHAVQNGADGKPAKAKQALCMAVSAKVDHNLTALACLVPSPDAFAPDAYGWDDTDLKDGIPVFNLLNLRPITLSFPDGTKVHFSCDHLGTEQ